MVAFLGYNPFAAQTGAYGTEAEREKDNGRSWGDRLLEFRKAGGLTQKQLARKPHVDPSTLARWERGERAPTAIFLIKVKTLLQSGLVAVDSFGEL